MKSVAVLGGGISGLSCAHYLLKFGNSVIDKVILIEASDRIGGWIHSKRFDDGIVHEIGPKGVRSVGMNGMNSLLLVEDVGLAQDVIHFSRSNAAAKKRYIWYKDEMHTLPGSLLSIFQKSTPFTQPLAKYIWNEIRTPKLPLNDAEDISVYDFFSKRFGEEVAKFVSDPMCRGITAGDARKLSVKAMFPPVFQAERRAGSIFKGLLTSKRQADPIYLEAKASPLVSRSRSEAWASWSFKSGLSQLPEAIYKNLKSHSKFEDKTGHLCEHIMFKADGTSVVHISNATSIKPIAVHHVISTIPSFRLAKCISSVKYPDLHKSLTAIKHVPVAVVCLEYSGCQVAKDKGFGFLTPSFGDLPILGIVFDSCSYPQHDAGKDVTRLTVMMGGEWFEQLFGDPSSVTSDSMLETAVKAVHKCLGIKDNPVRNLVAIHKECIPQYYLGHSVNVEEGLEAIKRHKLNLDVTGFSYLGVGVNDNILNARRTAEKFLESLH